ncbi:MAG: YjfB family protein [Lachnospiraceae bacterium]
MDIAALSTAMSMEKLQVNVGYAMMAKVMDTMEMSTEAMAEMLESAAQISGGASIPGLGENIDILV